jgi:ubiquitin C
MHIRIIHIPSKIYITTEREPVLVDIAPSCTIKQLKDKIAQHINVPSDHQFLSSDGRTLEDEHTLASYDDIKDGSTLWMVIYPGDSRKIHHVFILIHNLDKEHSMYISDEEREVIDLNIGFYETVAQVKQAIFERTSIPTSKQRLIFAGKQLEDTRVFLDYNVQKDSTIRVIVKT